MLVRIKFRICEGEGTMRFLVTGITGFAGPHLANLLLDEGHDVFGLVRGSNGNQADVLDIIPLEEFQKITWLFGDLTDYCSLENIFKKYQFDGVFHLAAQSHPPTSFTNPVCTFSTNVQGSVNLLVAVRSYQNECRIHFCSTSEVYGDICKDTGILKEIFLSICPTFL